MNPFDHNKFLGYVSEVTPQYVRMQVPSAKLLRAFYFDGQIFLGGNVGSFVVIEGQEYGFLCRLYEINLPQSEKREISDQNINDESRDFHPMGKIEILALFDVFHPAVITKTVSRYPTVGAKVYSCSDDQIESYIKKFGVKSGEQDVPYAPLGKLTSNDAVCNISLNSLFGRHCGVLGTTGGGKSWTVAKLLELVSEYTKNKCILIDATGEYGDIKNKLDIEFGSGKYIFNYRNLTIDELYFLLRPSSKVQVPKLMDAIRSLKMVELDEGNSLSYYYQQDDTGKLLNNCISKERHSKIILGTFYKKHIVDIEGNKCHFDFKMLPKQIAEECVWPSNQKDFNSWGARNDNDAVNCASLISRIRNVMAMPDYNRVFGFRKDNLLEEPKEESKDVEGVIDDFLKAKPEAILRFDFTRVGYDYQVREILVNAIGKHLLEKARSGQFKKNPVIVFIDEAHQFLNKNITDEYFGAKPLDAFEQISKEARKYGLFLCIATQMPRDVPIGTLSQLGTFIVHRLINDQDKKAVESAASSANRNSLAFLPVLGEGEALLIGVDFPMPLTIKINEPKNKPDSQTPKLTGK